MGMHWVPPSFINVIFTVQFGFFLLPVVSLPYVAICCANYFVYECPKPFLPVSPNQYNPLEVFLSVVVLLTEFRLEELLLWILISCHSGHISAAE